MMLGADVSDLSTEATGAAARLGLSIVVPMLNEAAGLPRLHDHTEIGMKRRGLKRNATEYITQNLAVTCSGHFSTPAFLCTVLTLGIDNVMFSIDWPFVNNQRATDWIKTIPLSAEDRVKLLNGNAKRLLKL